ncbi:MAG TPA: hypothetical protein H9717_05240 [Candidatus Eisenbergiella merdipullorum]|uniref:Uncharacterized protein n=1 Tax=Candidatus Eisenbergiella merdipullorum TaxID=2838553 RepID=A0A9D2KZM9_9FIRM|nr:hypothetical protein [Candidatus Eisenbergiella merdipullorum]
MIHTKGLRTGKRPGGFLPLLLLVSILGMLTWEMACGAAHQAEPEEVFAAALLEKSGQALLVGVQEESPEVESPDFAIASSEGKGAAASASSCLRKEISFRTLKTVVFLAGFLFAGKNPAFLVRKFLSAFPFPETPHPARFLRELFIQKKKDGKKRRLLLTPEY